MLIDFYTNNEPLTSYYLKTNVHAEYDHRCSSNAINMNIVDMKRCLWALLALFFNCWIPAKEAILLVDYNASAQRNRAAPGIR